MRDAAPLFGGELEIVQRALHEPGCEELEDVHAPGCVREAAARVELVRVDGELRAGRIGREYGEASADARSCGHAAEDRLNARVFQHLVGEGYECAVNIVRGDSGGDAVDVGLSHDDPSGSLLGCIIWWRSMSLRCHHKSMVIFEFGVCGGTPPPHTFG